MSNDTKCAKCGKYSGPATLCYDCEKQTLQPIASQMKDIVEKIVERSNEVHGREVITPEVKNYLSQKFCVAMLSNDPVVAQVAKDLWFQITGELK